MDPETERIINVITQAEKAIDHHKTISKILVFEDNETEFYSAAKNVCNKIKDKVLAKNIKANYLNKLESDISQLINTLPYRNNTFEQLNNEQNKVSNKKNLSNSFTGFKAQLAKLSLNLDFFNKLNFFSENIVAIGANGSGKTSLANHLKTYLQNNGIVISAQRVLRIPQFRQINNPINTLQELSRYQKYDKTFKNEDSYNRLHDEFDKILQNLIANDISINNDYTKRAIELGNLNQEIPKPAISNLVRAFSIWNDLIGHRKIETKDGVNIVVSYNGTHYPAIQMSEGEKVILYLIAQILQAPENGFVIIDEPEMHLHKTILQKLWDKMEIEREDCIFIYLTHDLDFAESRKTAKKIWIKSYIPQNNWEFFDIPENEIPETLLLKLLGSKKKILFCESKETVNNDISDADLYRILFPNFTIEPVEGCSSVINYTRTFNKIPNTHSRALGIIDRDFRGNSEIFSLNSDGIYTIEYAEKENLFLDLDFLKLFAFWDNKSDEIDFEKIKEDVLSELGRDKTKQVSYYLSSKINHYFKTAHISKGKTLNEVKSKLEQFNDNIKIDEWNNGRSSYIDEIIEQKNYENAMKVFNNKGLRQIMSKHFDTNYFAKNCFKFLKKNDDAKKLLLKRIDRNLIEEHDKI